MLAFHLSGFQAIHKTWFERGKQRVVPTYGKHRGVKLVGYLNYETGEVYCEEHETYDAVVFLGFLEHVLSRNPDGKTVLILDNARIHHAKLLIPCSRTKPATLSVTKVYDWHLSTSGCPTCNCNLR